MKPAARSNCFRLRNRIRVFFLSVSILLLSIAVFAEDVIVTKAFPIKFRKVDEVASVVNDLLSDQGAVTLQPKMKTLIVRDHQQNMRQIEMTIAALDVPPPNAEVSVKLILARKSTEPVPISEEIRNIARIGEVLRYNNYSLLDAGLVQSAEGNESRLTLAKDYQLSFVTEVIQEGNGIIRLKNFQLKKKSGPGRAKNAFVPLLSVTVNLRNEETVVLGASRFEDSDQALLLILLGKVKR